MEPGPGTPQPCSPAAPQPRTAAASARGTAAARWRRGPPGPPRPASPALPPPRAPAHAPAHGSEGAGRGARTPGFTNDPQPHRPARADAVLREGSGPDPPRAVEKPQSEATHLPDSKLAQLSLTEVRSLPPSRPAAHTPTTPLSLSTTDALRSSGVPQNGGRVLASFPDPPSLGPCRVTPLDLEPEVSLSQGRGPSVRDPAGDPRSAGLGGPVAGREQPLETFAFCQGVEFASLSSLSTRF